MRSAVLKEVRYRKAGTADALVVVPENLLGDGMDDLLSLPHHREEVADLYSADGIEVDVGVEGVVWAILPRPDIDTAAL